jgi:hypothetical protein
MQKGREGALVEYEGESYVDSRRRRKAKSPVLAWKKERIMMNRGGD